MSPRIRKGRRARVCGIDDGPFKRSGRGEILVVGAIVQAGELQGVLSTRVRRDGWNSTDRIASMILDSKFHSQLHAVMLDGVAVGGFNVVDIAGLSRKIGLPVITVMRKRPDFPAMEAALTRLSRPEKRMELIRRAGPVRKAGPIFFQTAGIRPESALRLLDEEAVHGHIPEPVRLAHMIAGGVVAGQSGKRA